MWWLSRVFFSFVFLFTIVLSIPVIFDVGGRESGLAYSLALFSFYFFYSAFKLATPPSSRVRWMLGGIIRLSQWVVIPVLLVWSLDRFAVDADSNWLEKITGAAEATRNADTWGEYVFGKGGLLQGMTIGGWDVTLRYSSPVFQLLEGFCSLLVIQAAGQITRWLVNRGRSDTWVIILLVFSASIIASAVYFLWRVANFPHISNIDATLIGVTMTSAVFLGAYGIGSGRGNPVESSLLFAYVVLCVYQIFTDYMPSDPAAAAAAVAEAELEAQQQEFPPLPPAIMASISTLMHFIGTLPSAIHSTLTLLYAAFQTITPSVIISLTYRIIVFYCATRIIPAVKEVGARALVDEMVDQEDSAGRLLDFLSWFSPSILIAVYTSLLLQHFTTSDGEDGWTLKGGDVGGSTWRWVNVVGTMSLYALELYLGGEDSHWKTD